MKKLFLLFFFLLAHYVICVAQIVPGKTYKIGSYYSKTKSISVDNNSLADKAKLILWTETNVHAQRWLAEQATEGFFYLTNVYTGKAMHYSSTRPKPGDIIDQVTKAKTNYFQWEFIPVENRSYREGYYIRSYFKSADNYLYLEVNDDTEGSAISVQLKKTDSDSIRQIWRMTPMEDYTTNKLTNAVRSEVMQGWKDRYFKWLKDETTGFWGEAEMIETILDAYETTGNPEYKTMFEQAYEHFVGYPAGWGLIGNGQEWSWNAFNDDITWAVLASIRAYLMFGEHSNSGINYLTIAKSNYDMMYARALMPSGMLVWNADIDPIGTNSCINGPAEVAACYLAMATGDDSYYEKAKNLYALQRQYLYNSSTGKVFDSGAWNGDVFRVTNDWSSTYNQGAFLGAAVMLYNRYGDEQYKQDAHKIVEFTRKDMCNDLGVVKVCGSGENLQGFKGILMRYLRRYVVDLALEESVGWLQRNAMHAFNNRNSKKIIWTAWWQKSTENFYFADDKYDYSNQPFGSSTAVSAAFNAPLDENKIVKNAYTTIEAEYFDYVKGIYVKPVTGDEMQFVENIRDGYYTAYNNVNFDGEQLKNATFRVLPAITSGEIEIHLASPTGRLIGTANIPADGSGDWIDVTCQVENVSGRHHLYLVYKGTDFKVDKFWFNEGDEPSGIKEHSRAVNIELYPNPGATHLNVKIPLDGYLSVYDFTGKRLSSEKVLPGVLNVNVENYSPGIYFINLITNEGKSAVRFVKK